MLYGLIWRDVEGGILVFVDEAADMFSCCAAITAAASSGV